MLFAKQQDYNPIEQYQPTSFTYGSGIYTPQKPKIVYNNGIINQQPRTRAEREYQKEIEIKSAGPRIQQNYSQKDDMKSLLHSPMPDTTLFQAERDRFAKDFAAEDKQQREMQYKLKQLSYESRRLANLQRDGILWQRNEEYLLKDEQRRQYHSEQFTRGKRNTNGLAYNPITLEYAQNEAGQALKRYDEQHQVRKFVRAKNLDTRANCGFNVLSGQERQGVDYIVPDELRHDYQQRVRDLQNQLNLKHYALQQQIFQ
ncbi:unnamed protein product [Paramecium pentaurelia]|uniref:Uncharacterized protein n=1 Tax=Paramecium pentaurelia TaxID=43138 RepID=A0A8S1S5N9_9CILI|nr:unnamed protein product [Paramecium pentaurelia]